MPRKLTDLLLQFLLGTVQKTPDLYLDELREMLQASCGTEVSHTTVWRTLCRYGFTMKKVSCDFQILPPILVVTLTSS
jgi:transposase